MIEVCTVLQKSRSQSLKKILTKIKDFINSKKITDAKMTITGLSPKEFTFTVFPIWPSFKQVKPLPKTLQQPTYQLEMQHQIPTPISSSMQFNNSSQSIIIEDNKNKELILNLLGINISQLRVNQSEILFKEDIVAPDKLCEQINSFVENLKQYEKDQNYLKPDIIKNRNVYYVGNKFYSQYELSDEFTFKQYKLGGEKQQQEFFKRQYPKILKGCELVRWNGSVLETSWLIKNWKETEEERDLLEQSRISYKSKNSFQKTQSKTYSPQSNKKAKKPYIVTKQLFIIKSQDNYNKILPRLYLSFLLESKKIKQQNQSFKLTLNMNSKQKQRPKQNLDKSKNNKQRQNQGASLNLQFDSKGQGCYELFQKIKEQYKIFKIKTSPTKFDIHQNTGVKQFIQKEFLCKINKEHTYVIPSQEQRLRQFFQTSLLENKSNQIAQSSFLQIHEHELAKLQMNKSLSRTLRFHYKFQSIKQISQNELRIEMGKKRIGIKCVESFDNRGSRGRNKKPKFTIPPIFSNIFQQTGVLKQYLQSVSHILPQNQPIIQFNKQKIKTKQHLDEHLFELMELIHKCKDGCVIFIVTKEISAVVRLLREKMEESSEKCKTSKVSVEYSNKCSSDMSVLDEINKTIGDKIHSHKDLEMIAQIKGIGQFIVSEELTDSGVTVRENRILFKSNQQFQNLINYINIR